MVQSLSCEDLPVPTEEGMSSRKGPPRFARARSAIVVLVAVVLLALYAVNHRAELGEIYHELHQTLPFASQAQAVQEGERLRTGCTELPAKKDRS